MDSISERILELAHELQAIASAGLLYCKQPFEIERYQRIKGISAELTECISDEPLSKIKSIFDENSGYQTPKISTRAAIFNIKKEILLVKDYDQKWVMPGGWCEFNLSIRENMKKEVLEEAGLSVDPYKLVGLFDHRKRNNSQSFFYVTHVFMLCRVVEGHFHQNSETTQSQYFSLDNLPELNEHKTSPEQIQLCFEAYMQNNWEPIVD